MKVLTRHTLASVLKIGLVTAMLAALMLVGVDLFSNLDSYIGRSIGFARAFMLSMLYYPEAFLLALGPSFLFSTTYYLSMLNASNEMICILNAGVSSRRVVTPLLFLAVALAVFYFIFNEAVAIKSTNIKESKTKVSGEVSTLDNTDISLGDMQSGYMVHASRYDDASQTLYGVSYVEKDGFRIRRIDAYSAVYDASSGFWTFHDCCIHDATLTVGPVSETSDETTEAVSTYRIDSLDVQKMTLEPQLFRNMSSEISKMSLDLARAYLKRIRRLNPDEYARIGTDFYKRVFSCLTPLVMMIIACSMNYRFKKNVLFFSLVCSICIAVVYYVIQMMTVMLADQGVIAPWLGILIPFAVILGLSSILSIVMKA